MKRRRAPEAQSAGRGKAALARVGPALVRRGHHAGAGICSLRDCGLEAMHPQGQKKNRRVVRAEWREPVPAAGQSG